MQEGKARQRAAFVDEPDERMTLLARAMEQHLSGVMITDRRDCIVFVNQEFCRSSGYTKEEVLGKKIPFLKSGAQLPEFYQAMLTTIRSGGIWRGKLHHRKKTGELFWENVVVSPLYDENDEISHFLTLKEDLTLQEEAAAVLRKADQKLREDLMLAGKIQRALLPKKVNAEGITVQSIYEPLNLVSGDIYDYLWCAEEKRCVGYVADVMGHGLGAALQTSALMVLGRQVLQSKEPLAKRVEELNRNLTPYLNDGTFAALLAFEVDVKQGVLRYVSAGINHFIAMHDGETITVRVPGIFLGILPDMKYEEEELKCRSGDCFFFCSDGLLDLLQEEHRLQFEDYASCMQLMESLVVEGQGHDDATVVGVRL